jgi:hypothetical protein
MHHQGSILFGPQVHVHVLQDRCGMVMLGIMQLVSYFQTRKTLIWLWNRELIWTVIVQKEHANSWIFLNHRGFVTYCNSVRKHITYTWNLKISFVIETSYQSLKCDQGLRFFCKNDKHQMLCTTGDSTFLDRRSMCIYCKIELHGIIGGWCCFATKTRHTWGIWYFRMRNTLN